MVNTQNGLNVAWNNAASGELLVYYRASSSRVIQLLYIYGYNEILVFIRVQSGENIWGEWVQLPTRAEMDAVSSNRIQKTITFDRISPGGWAVAWINGLEIYSNIKQKIKSISLVSSDGAVIPYVILHSNGYLYCSAYNVYSSEASNVSIDVIIELSV